MWNIHMAVLICLMLPCQIAVPSLGPAVNTADLQVAKSRLWFDDLKLGIEGALGGGSSAA